MTPEATWALLFWKPMSPRILTARFNSKGRKVTIIQCYAPTNEVAIEEKDEFYQQIQAAIDKTPKRDTKAKVGSDNTNSEHVMGWQTLLCRMKREYSNENTFWSLFYSTKLFVRWTYIIKWRYKFLPKRTAYIYYKLKGVTASMRRTASSIGFIKNALFNNVVPTFVKVKENFKQEKDRDNASRKILKEQLSEDARSLK